MSVETINVPDIGSDSAEVVEILISVGDVVEPDQSLFVLESDKASVEMPCPKAGKVVSIALAVGDNVSEGTTALDIEVTAGDTQADTSVEESSPVVVESVVESTVESAADSSEPPQTDDSNKVSQSILCTIPDVGSDESEVIEIMLAVGDAVQEGDSVCVAESDKASLEIPAEHTGVVEALHISQGDKVAIGMPMLTIRTEGAAESKDENVAEPAANLSDPEPPVLEDVVVLGNESTEEQTYVVPDLGADSAEVIEMSVAVGDEVSEGDSICVVETDKASVEIPAPVSGSIIELFVGPGDSIAAGVDLVCIASVVSVVAPKAESATPVSADSSVSEPPAQIEPSIERKPEAASTSPATSSSSFSGMVYAGPAVRKQARELGVDLSKIRGTGARGRIVRDDVNAYVKQAMKGGGAAASGSGAGLPTIPATDWAKFGEVSVEPMSRIHKATAANMLRNWLNVPHVTQFDDADVTELETYRGYLKSEAKARGIKMTPVAFILKAAAVALKENPKMNSSIHSNGEDLVFRNYIHIGLAVDTPSGLMVPVIKDVDKKDIWEVAADIAQLAGKAKDGKLGPKEMQGGCFTISSLGAIGGKGFTPIVSAPQAAILGVSNTSIQPVWDGKEFVPRKMMPLSLSYDHRAVNGADAGKFLTMLVAVLGDHDRIWNG